MPKLTPTQFAEKQARRLKASLEDIRTGVETVKEAPTKAAARKLDKMSSRFNEAMASGKTKRNMEAATLEDWKGQMLEKGVNRISQGIDRAKGKVESFYSQLGPYEDRLKAEIDAMPDQTLEDSIARQAAWTRGMAKFRKQ